MRTGVGWDWNGDGVGVGEDESGDWDGVGDGIEMVMRIGMEVLIGKGWGQMRTG